MSNPFYVSPADQVALARVKSADINNLDAAVDVAFDAVNAAMALKGTTTGQTWTGTHDFSGATSVLVPTPTLMAQAVNKAYADSMMAAATAAGAAGQLPSQGGNAGKFLSTNGTQSSWAYAGISTINATITTSTTIAGTYLYVPVAMTTLGQSVTLPSALTLSAGGPQYVIDNTKGGYPVGIRDNTGTLLMAVAPGGEALVSLKDNTTQAGIWSVTGSNLEPGLITIDNTFSSTYSSTALIPFVALDNNTSIHFAALSSGFAAFVVDNAGKVLSTPVTVDATSGMVPVQCFKVSNTSAIVFYSDQSSAQKAVVLTLNGSTPTYSLSVGVAVALTALHGQTLENFTGAPKIAQLTASLYLVSSSSATNASVQAFSVTGATITAGTAATFGSSTILASTTAYALTSTTALVLYKSGAGAPYVGNAVVVSVSGATCTVGTPITTANSSFTTPPSSVLLSSTKVLFADDANSGHMQVYPLTISGTTVTLGTQANVELTSFAAASAYTTNSATRYNPHLWAIGSNTAGLWYLDSNGVSRVCVLTESSGTVTAGAIVYGSISNAVSTLDQAGAIFPQGTTEFVSLRQEVPATNIYRFRVQANKISGSVITSGAVSSKHLDTISLATGAGALSQSLVRLSSGDYSAIPGGNTSVTGFPIFRSNGDAISYRGDISCPTSYSSGQGGRPVAFSNRMVILQNDSWSGQTGGAGTLKLRLLNVEIAA